MKLLTRTLAAVAFVTLSATGAAAQAKAPDFNGQWEMNAAKSDFGPMAGMLTKASLSVEQTATNIKYSQSLGTPQGDRTLAQEFPLDGKEITETAPTGQTVVRSAKVAGDTLVFSGKVQGTDQGQASRWTLAPDGKSMTIDQQFSGPMGTMAMKIVFDKK